MENLSTTIKNSADTIRDKFSVKKIILFGSSASGTTDRDSDIDLCIITEITGRRKIDTIRDIRRELAQLSSHPYPFDILVYNEKEFNERAALKNSFESEIANKGTILVE